jgi:hypothetical protein
MKVSDLCKMIEDSIHSGQYPFETETQKKFAGMLQVLSRSDTEDLHDAANIKIETRVQDLYITNNYIPNIQHLPGLIEMDVIDSFRMICRKIDRLDKVMQLK